MVHYVDLPVYGTPMSLAWKKHRMRCVNEHCAKKSWMLERPPHRGQEVPADHGAAKWATRQVGDGRTVKEVAAELACDWHTVNDAVYHLWRGPARGRSQAPEPDHRHRARRDLLRQAQHEEAHATTPPPWPMWRTTRSSTSCRRANTPKWPAGCDKQPKPGRSASASGPSTCRRPTPRSTRLSCPRRHQVVDPFHVISLANRGLDAVRRRVQIEQIRPPRSARRSALSGPPGAAHGRREARRRSHGAPGLTPRARRPGRRSGHRLSGQRAPA